MLSYQLKKSRKIPSHKILRNNQDDKDGDKSQQTQPQQRLVANTQFWNGKFVDNTLQNHHKRKDNNKRTNPKIQQ